MDPAVSVNEMNFRGAFSKKIMYVLRATFHLGRATPFQENASSFPQAFPPAEFFAFHQSLKRQAGCLSRLSLRPNSFLGSNTHFPLGGGGAFFFALVVGLLWDIFFLFSWQRGFSIVSERIGLRLLATEMTAVTWKEAS